MAAVDFHNRVEQLFIAYLGRPANSTELELYSNEYNSIVEWNAANPTQPKTFYNMNLSTYLLDNSAFKGSTNYGQVVEDMYTRLTGAAIPMDLYNVLVGRMMDGNWGVDKLAIKMLKATGLWAFEDGTYGKPPAFQFQATATQPAVTTDFTVSTAADHASAQAKVEGAKLFTEQLDTPAENTALTTAQGATSATTWLAGVTGTAPATAESAAAGVTGATEAATGASGENYMLTEGADTKVGTSGNDTFTGNEVSIATGLTASLTALDNLDGGAGKDTLNVVATAAALDTTGLGLTIKNIEVANFQATKALTVDSTAWTGLTNLNVTKSVAAAILTAANTTDVNVAGGEAAVTVTGGKSVTVAQAMDKAADAIVINKAGDVTVTATDSDAAAAAAAAGIKIGVGAGNAVTGAVAVTSTGAKIVGGTGAVAMDDIEIAGGTTVTVTQAATADMGDVATKGIATDVVTQGAVTVTGGNATTSVTVVQGDQVTAKGAAAAAGAFQTQTVTFNALVAGNTVTVNGLTFTAAVNMTAAEVAQAFAGLTSGDRQDDGGPTAKGIYTGVNTAGFTTGAAVGATVTYTETVAGTGTAVAAPAAAQGTGTTVPTAPTIAAGTTGVTAVAAVTGVLGVANGAVVIDDSAAKTITDITVDGYGAGATLGAAAGTGSLDKLTTLTLKNSGAGTAALTTASVGALTLNLTDVDAAVNLGASLTALTINTSGEASTGAISAAGAKTVTINAEAALSGASNFTAATLVDVNGTAAVNLTGAITNAATLKTIDASGNSGGVTAVLGATNSVAFTGGAGNDALTLATAGIAATANIDMGAGNDTLTIGAGTLASNILGTIKGGDGTDTLAMGFADAVAVSADTAFHAKVGGFERLTINNAATNADAIANEVSTVNLANLAYNYVTVNGTKAPTLAADILALTGMAANGTVAFGAGSDAAALYTVALADATGGADVLNYVLASTVVNAPGTLGTAINAGTITANLVETFNVTSTAADPDGATNVITANGDTVKAINVSGNAGVNLTSTATTLKTVDAGGLTGTGAAGGLVFTASNASMTVTGGAGNDVITVAATADGGTFNGGAGNDTFVIAAGADLITLNGGAGADTFDFNGVSSNKSNYAVISGVNTGDTIDMAGLAAVGFAATKITLSVGATESTQAYLDQAMVNLAAGQAGWFQLGGNTFVVADVGAESATAFIDGQDFVTMIVGLVDLSTASFNGTSGTLEIV